MQLKQPFQANRRANVSVEFALILAFFLLPLLAGAADFVSILNGRAQLNTALQALIYYAWTNYYGPSGASAVTAYTQPATSGEAGLITAINGASLFHITYSAPALKYVCVTSSGGTYSVPSLLSAWTSSSSCTAGNMQYDIQYTLTTSVALPFPPPLKLFANPFTLTTTGAAQIGSIH